MSVTFVESTLVPPTRGRAQAEPSPLLGDVKTAIATGKTYQTRVVGEDAYNAIKRELERAARQVREKIDGIERPASVKVWSAQVGKQTVLAWQAFAPKPARPVEKADCPRCGRNVSLTAEGNLRKHKASDGTDCE